MALRGYTIIPELVIDEEGNEIKINRPISLHGIQFQKLIFESYFIRRGYVQLTLPELRTMNWKYAWRLFFVMQELDQIEAERQKEEMEKVKRRR